MPAAEYSTHMKEERGRVYGDVIIDGPYTLHHNAAISGDVRVIEGGKAYLRGNVGGDLIVDYGGRVHVYGHIHGNLIMFRGCKVIISGAIAGNATNTNSRLFIDRHGRVLGRIKTVGKHAETQIEDAYGVKIERGK